MVVPRRPQAASDSTHSAPSAVTVVVHETPEALTVTSLPTVDSVAAIATVKFAAAPRFSTVTASITGFMYELDFA